MSRARAHQVVSFGFTAGTSGTLYLVGIDILLSTAIGAAVGVSIALLFRINREFPERWTGDGWQDGRWTAVSLTVTNFAALVGIQLLPLSDGYNAAVAFLLIFVGLSAYLGGSLAEMERKRSDNKRTRQGTAGSKADHS